MEITTEYLIDEVKKVVTEPYSEWKIGIASDGDFDSERYINITFFNPENNVATLATYLHFRELGMKAVEPFFTDAKYLYLYKIDGAKFPFHFC